MTRDEKLIDDMADRAMELHHDEKKPCSFISAVGQALDENGFRNSPQRGTAFSKIAKECRARRQWQDDGKKNPQEAVVIASPQLSLFA